MPCYHPWKHQAYAHELPCGQCRGCRLDRALEWATRCVHEAQTHEENCFATFTYTNAPASLQHRDYQLFMKKLRRKNPDRDIRYYMCGEYGEAFGRPHFHACLFGIDFADKYPWRKNQAGDQLYRSPSLELLWKHGHSEIGAVTFQSAAYIARYIMQKITGDLAVSHYTYIDQYGEIHQRKPEYNQMSKRPAIGKRWLERYKTDVYPDDKVIINGKSHKPPRYYDNQLTKEELHQLKKERKLAMRPLYKDNTPKRRKAKETVAAARTKLLLRTLT